MLENFDVRLGALHLKIKSNSALTCYSVSSKRNKRGNSYRFDKNLGKNFSLKIHSPILRDGLSFAHTSVVTRALLENTVHSVGHSVVASKVGNS